jgi:hypothetical protein
MRETLFITGFLLDSGAVARKWGANVLPVSDSTFSSEKQGKRTALLRPCVNMTTVKAASPPPHSTNLFAQQ